MTPRTAATLLCLGFAGFVRATLLVEIGSGTDTYLRDLREYVGTGYGGEYARCVRLDFLTAAAPVNQFKFPTYPPQSGYWISNTERTSSRQFGIDAAYQSSLTSDGVPVVVTGGTGVSYYNGVSKPYEYRLPGAGSRDVYVAEYMGASWILHYPDGSTAPRAENAVSIVKITLGLVRRDVEMAAIDSRRVYGQPNLDGELPGDPNADLRNPSFAGWTYKGGLFVGQATGKDASGTSRIQGWVPTATMTYPLMSSLNLRALGRPVGYAAPTLRLYAPAANDPNLGATVTTATWANRWDLAAATLLGEDTPVGTLPSGEFLNFVYENQWGTNPSKVGLAMSGESPGMAGTWQYFAGAAHEGARPLSESRPRLWTVDRTAWVTQTQTQTSGWNQDDI